MENFPIKTTEVSIGKITEKKHKNNSQERFILFLTRVDRSRCFVRLYNNDTMIISNDARRVQRSSI